MEQSSFIGKIKKRFFLYLIKKGVSDTFKKSRYLGKNIDDISKLFRESNIDKLEDISGDFEYKNLEVIRQYRVFITKKSQEYFLIKDGIICHTGFYDKTKKDKEYGLDIINIDYIEYNNLIKAFSFYAFMINNPDTYNNKYEIYIKDHCQEIMRNLSGCPINISF